MKIFAETFRAFNFQSGIQRIHMAFRSSIAAMEVDRLRAAADYEAYSKRGTDDSIYDEDGVLVHSSEVSLDYAILEAMVASTVVREAFITSAFHYWERSARSWTGLHKPAHNFEVLSAAVETMGIPISGELAYLNALNNLLKHDNSKHGPMILDAKNGLYYLDMPPLGDNWRGCLNITDAHVLDAFGIVEKSGPQVD